MYIFRSNLKPSYWRCDLKWVFSIIFTLIFILTLSVNLVYNLTSKEVSEKIYRRTIEEMSKREDLEKNYPKLILKAQMEPKKILGNPLGLKITGQEIQDLSLAQFKELVFKKTFEKYYEKSETYKGEGEFLVNLINAKNHQKLTYFLKILPIILVLSAILVMVFAFSFDKLITLGFDITIASLPFVLAYSRLLEQAKTIKEGFGVIFAPTIEELQPVFATYNYILIGGIILVACGILGFIVKRIYFKLKRPV